MDKDRVDGAAKTAGGKVKEAVGKLTGDQKTVAEGQAEQKVGKVQNAVGGFEGHHSRHSKGEVALHALRPATLTTQGASPFRVHRRFENADFNGASP